MVRITHEKVRVIQKPTDQAVQSNRRHQTRTGSKANENPLSTHGSGENPSYTEDVDLIRGTRFKPKTSIVDGIEKLFSWYKVDGRLN